MNRVVARIGRMVLDDADDVRLFTMALAGEEAAFVMLYRRWQGNVYRFALRISNSSSIAEDVTQEVFLALIGGASRFDPTLGSFSAYMYGIARNHILRRMTRERIFTPMAGNADGGQNASTASLRASADPLNDFSRREMIETLHRAIAALPLRYREVVVLCELQEMNYAEAARVIGCPDGTVRSRLHRARLLLADKLREQTRENSHAPEIGPARCLP